jgi:hypothetical protein
MDKMTTVTISLDEYNRLIEDRDFLAELRALGVDNWEGYDEACASISEKETD